MEESRDTIDNIKNAETAINQDPPAAEPERQQYFMERAKGQLAELSGTGQITGGRAFGPSGTATDLLHQHLWVPDECQGFGEASGDFGDNRLPGCRIRESGFCAL